MSVYFKCGVFPEGTVEEYVLGAIGDYKIISAKIDTTPKNKKALTLSLEREMEKETFQIQGPVYEIFLDDFEVKEEDLKKLIGKTVKAYVNSNYHIRGISPKL